MRLSRRLRLGAGGLILVVTASLAWFFVLRSPAASEALGKVWLNGFTDLLTSSRLLGTRGRESLAFFPGLKPQAATGCVESWSFEDRFAPIIVEQRLQLGRLDGEDCDKAQFGLLWTTLRQSAGVTPGALAERFTAAFGPPDIDREPGLHGAVNSTWLILDGAFVSLQEASGPDAAPNFVVGYNRYYAAPTTLPTTAESNAWMDRTVALVTGPALANARGPQAVALVDAPMQATPPVSDNGCKTESMSDLLRKGPIESGESLSLHHVEGTPCDQAAFASLSLRIWRFGPVTAAALVARIGATLGSSSLSRDFDHDDIAYQWQTKHGITVNLSEGLTGTARHWLGLRMSRRE